MNRTLFFRIIAITLFVAGTLYTRAQNPPHPNSGGAPTTTGNTTVGGQQGGAPIGSGNFLLIGLALLYATKKVRESRKEKTVL
jgi:hypothetical protein